MSKRYFSYIIPGKWKFERRCSAMLRWRKCAICAFRSLKNRFLSRTGKFPGMRRANISSYARRSENKKPTSYTHINCKAPRPCRSFGCRTGAPFTDLFFDFRQRYIWMMILRTMFQKWNFKQGSILGTPVKTGITGCTGMSSIKIRCSNKIFFWQTSVRCKVCFLFFYKRYDRF